jgi:hypothetical protein
MSEESFPSRSSGLFYLLQWQYITGSPPGGEAVVDVESSLGVLLLEEFVNVGQAGWEHLSHGRLYFF